MPYNRPYRSLDNPVLCSGLRSPWCQKPLIRQSPEKSGFWGVCLLKRAPNGPNRGFLTFRLFVRDLMKANTVPGQGSWRPFPWGNAVKHKHCWVILGLCWAHVGTFRVHVGPFHASSHSSHSGERRKHFSCSQDRRIHYVFQISCTYFCRALFCWSGQEQERLAFSNLEFFIQCGIM